MNNDNKTDKANIITPSLPREARLPINRCNLPPQILGSLTFQQHPVAVQLDGVQVLHKQLFELLARNPEQAARAEQFIDYMVVQFRLQRLEDAGLIKDQDRGKADYLRLLRR